MSVVEKKIGNMDGVSGISGVDENTNKELPKRNKIGIFIGEKDIRQDWEISNVIPTYRNDQIFSYNFNLPISTICNFMDLEVLQYLPEIQRGVKIVRGIESPLINTTKTKEIAECIMKDEFFGGTLSFVIIDSYLDKPDVKFKYDEENNVINCNLPIFITDGMHRISSARIINDLWYKIKRNKEGMINPEKYEFPISLIICSMDDAKVMFAQSTLSLKISKVRSEVLSIGTYKNTITNEIIKNSDLRNKVEKYVSNIKNTNNIVTYSILSTQIDNQFKPKTKLESEEISSYLTDFMNNLIFLFPYTLGEMDIAERKLGREKDYSGELLMWHGFISIAKALYRDENWKEKLKKLRQPIEIGEFAGRLLDKNNPIWNYIKNGAGRLVNGSPQQSFVRKIFSTFVIDENTFNKLVKETLEKQKV